MAKPFPHFRQMDQMDCGPTCLRMICKYFGRHYTAQTLREYSQMSREGVSMLGIAEAADIIGLKTIGVKITLEKLMEQATLPCILHWGQNHFVVLYCITNNKISAGNLWLKGIRGGRRGISTSDNAEEDSRIHGYSSGYESVGESVIPIFHIADPAKGLIVCSKDEFCRKWISTKNAGQGQGVALLIEPTAKFFEEKGEETSVLNFAHLIRYIWQYRRLVVQLLLGMLVGSGISLLFPILTQSVVDVGIATSNLSFIYIVLVAQVILLLSSATVEFIRSWILLHISTRLNLSILSEFLSKLMHLPLSYFDVKQFGDIMQRIGDHQRIESFLTGRALSLIFSIFNLVAFGLVLAYYYWIVFAVASGASLIYILWVTLFLKERSKLDTRRFQVASKNQSQIIQLIHGMQDIKLAGAEMFKRWEWERTQAMLFKWNVKSLSLTQIQQAGALLINQSKNIFISFLAAKAVIDGNITLGAMMSVQYILGQFNAPIEQFISFLQAWQDAKLSLERLNEVHALRDEEPAGVVLRKDWDHQQDISIANLSYTYPGAGNDPVLRNLNLTIPYGKTTAIVGTSGSGKTTLLKLLLRHYEPQAGRIVLVNSKIDSASSNFTFLSTGLELTKDVIDLNRNGNGIGLNSISHSAWRRQCGVVMQEGFLFSDTIAGNIAVGEENIDKEKLYKAAITANIHDFIESLPLGYHTKIGGEGIGISQGQKQRVLIARAVYKDPPLLMFDEATNALDANNELLILRNLEDFFRGRTVVVVAHRLSTVRNAEQIVVLDKGSIVEKGKHNDLIATRGKYYELVSNQLELSTR